MSRGMRSHSVNNRSWEKLWTGYIHKPWTLRYKLLQNFLWTFFNWSMWMTVSQGLGKKCILRHVIVVLSCSSRFSGIPSDCRDHYMLSQCSVTHITLVCSSSASISRASNLLVMHCILMWYILNKSNYRQHCLPSCGFFFVFVSSSSRTYFSIWFVISCVCFIELLLQLYLLLSVKVCCSTGISLPG